MILIAFCYPIKSSPFNFWPFPLSSNYFCSFSYSFFLFLSSLSNLIYLVSFSDSFAWNINIYSFIRLLSWSLIDCSYSYFICSANSTAYWDAKVCSYSFSEVKLATWYWSELFLDWRSWITDINDWLTSVEEPLLIKSLFKMSLFKTRLVSRSLI